MAAKEQAVSLETIYAFQKGLKRKAYDSESDDSTDITTNRSNKLKKKSRFVRRGQLSIAQAPVNYSEIVEHAGYERAILSRNLPLVGEDGYNIDSDDDEERVQSAVAEAAQQNPYASIQLHQLLAPLTSVTGLSAHPSLARPFLSRSLDQLAAQGSEWMHKENASLWNVKPLLTKLSGDHTWISCGRLATDKDVELFGDDSAAPQAANGSVAGPGQGTNTLHIIGEDQQGQEADGNKSGAASPAQSSSTAKAASREDIEMEDAATEDANIPETEKEKRSEEINGHASNRSPIQDDHPESEELVEDPDKTIDEPDDDQAKESKKAQIEEVDGGDDTIMEDEEPEAPEPGGDPGAANAVAPKTNGTGRRIDDGSDIHPLFISAPSAHPDRDIGLAPQDAEAVRYVLQLWVQKQEEVVRGTKKLYEGLLKANRLRQTVLHWSKAEAHVGELSDGEDWYDQEYWGLTEDLKKGHDEEEEETQQTQKKTRNRK